MNYSNPNTANGSPQRTRDEHAEQTFWSLLATLWHRRLLVVGVTAGAAVLSVVIALLLPNWYRADTRLLIPSGGGSGILSQAMMGNLRTASSLLGGITGDFQRHLSILDSRSVKENVVRHFDLIEVYDLEDIEDDDLAMHAALQTLDGNLDFVVDDEYNFLSVQVYDQDPQRAADMANYFVEELQRVNNELSSKSAHMYRTFVEQRYDRSMAELDSLLNVQRQIQEQYGVLDLETQGEQFYTGVTELRLAALQAEIQYERLLSEYGPDNSIVQGARQTAQATNRKYEAAMEGREQMLPVAKADLPEVARQMIALKQQQLLLGKVVEFMRPVLEEARLDEARQVEAVQVVDPAIAPAEKARPFRALIVIATTLSAFLLVVIYVFALTWWKRHHTEIADRLKRADTDGPAPPARTTSAPSPSTTAAP